MGAIKVRYLVEERLSNGSVAYYYHPPKKARLAGVAIAEALGSDPIEAARKAEEQNKRIDAWRGGQDEGGKSGPVEGSIAWLIEKFETSHQYKRKAPKTRHWYSGALRAFREIRLKTMTVGDFPAKFLTAAHVDKIYLQLQKIDPVTDEPTQLPWANAIMRAARRVFSLGVRWGDVAVNPFAKMGMTGAPARECYVPIGGVGRTPPDR